MKELKMRLEIDGRKFGIGIALSKDAKLIDYEESLHAMVQAMLRRIKIEYFAKEKPLKRRNHERS